MLKENYGSNPRPNILASLLDVRGTHYAYLKYSENNAQDPDFYCLALL